MDIPLHSGVVLSPVDRNLSNMCHPHFQLPFPFFCQFCWVLSIESFIPLPSILSSASIAIAHHRIGCHFHPSTSILIHPSIHPFANPFLSHWLSTIPFHLQPPFSPNFAPKLQLCSAGVTSINHTPNPPSFLFQPGTIALDPPSSSRFLPFLIFFLSLPLHFLCTAGLGFLPSILLFFSAAIQLNSPNQQLWQPMSRDSTKWVKKVWERRMDERSFAPGTPETFWLEWTNRGGEEEQQDRIGQRKVKAKPEWKWPSRQC